MNISKYLSAVVLAGCAFGNLHAVDSCKQTAQSCPKKMYVERKFVKATPEGIIVTRGKHAFLVKAIRADQKGLFFLKKDRLTSVVKGKKKWQCDRCGMVFNSEQALLWHILEEHS